MSKRPAPAAQRSVERPSDGKSRPADPPGGALAEAVPYASTLFVRDHCLCLHVQRAARALARRFDEALKPCGLTSHQFSLLMSLNRPAPPPMGAVAALIGMDRTTLTAALKPLERRGLVALLPGEADKRQRLILLLPAGKTALAAALPIWTRVHAAIESDLAGDAPADMMRGALNQLAAAA